MDIQRTNSKPQAAPSRGSAPIASPAQALGIETPSGTQAPQEARGASRADSYSSARAPDGGAAATRPGDPTEQGISIKAHRRASRSAQAASSAGGQPASASKAAAPRAPGPEYPLLARAGQALGLGAGVAVTELLAIVPGWNEPVLDGNGKPVASVPGAERIGDHDIRKRHQEVVGPQITALDEKIPGGALHDLVGGFGAGATEAPGASYRLEVEVEDGLRGLWKKLTGEK